MARSWPGFVSAKAMSIFLAKADVAELTGRKTKAKQIEQLRTMGLVFWINAHGVPVVPRSAIEGRTVQQESKREKVVSPAFSPGWSHDEAGKWIPPGLRVGGK